jgi:hypothetical protein
MSTAHPFQADFAAKILVSWFVAKTWPAFRDLWRESGMGELRSRTKVDITDGPRVRRESPESQSDPCE